MIPHNEIRMMALSAIPNVQLGGLDCPWCHGGKSHEKAFSIVRRNDGAILFVCHRATCNRHGSIDGSGIHVSATDREHAGFVPRVYNVPTRPLSTEEREFFEGTYGITNSLDFDWTVDIGSDRICIPVYGPFGGFRRGVELRSIDGHKPKTLSYKEVDRPWLGWQGKFPSDPDIPIVIVEDMISGAVVSQVFTSVCLFGTHITIDDMLEIAGFHSNLVLCLDRDATDKALQLKQKFRFLAPELRVVPLTRDLKYETPKRISEIINADLGYTV